MASISPYETPQYWERIMRALSKIENVGYRLGAGV
jgi:hypothetical protein